MWQESSHLVIFGFPASVTSNEQPCSDKSPVSRTGSRPYSPALCGRDSGNCGGVFTFGCPLCGVAGESLFSVAGIFGHNVEEIYYQCSWKVVIQSFLSVYMLIEISRVWYVEIWLNRILMLIWMPDVDMKKRILKITRIKNILMAPMLNNNNFLKEFKCVWPLLMQLFRFS